MRERGKREEGRQRGETDRQTDRQTERGTEREEEEKKREMGYVIHIFPIAAPKAVQQWRASSIQYEYNPSL